MTRKKLEFEPIARAFGNMIGDFITQAAKSGLEGAAEGATEAVLDHVQDRLRGADDKITTARKKAKARKKPLQKRQVIEVEVLDDEHREPRRH